MAHVLNKMKMPGVKLEDVKKQLELDAPAHAKEGLYLEHLWANDDDPDEILFLFRVDNLTEHKKRVAEIHAAARRENPDAPLPEKIYLSEKE